MEKEVFKKGRWVCFGDSITDASRVYGHPDFREMGGGYVGFINNHIKAMFEEFQVEIINKGINGNRTESLLKRLERDVLSLNPDLVTILIGINDVWHPRRDGVEPDFVQIEKNYREIIERIKERNIRLVILLPFLFPSSQFFIDLVPYWEQMRTLIFKLIEEYELEHIDLYHSMKKYADLVGNKEIARDGVHPTIFGHGIIAFELAKYFFNI